MHLLGGADDGVDRARLNAKRAADAGLLVDLRHRLQFFLLHAARLEFASKQFGELLGAVVAARRAQIDFRRAGGHRLGVGLAARKAALRALRLRQDGVDLFGERIAVDVEMHGGVAERESQNESDAGHDEEGGQHVASALNGNGRVRRSP